jgi:hypothetical protein
VPVSAGHLRRKREEQLVDSIISQGLPEKRRTAFMQHQAGIELVLQDAQNPTRRQPPVG